MGFIDSIKERVVNYAEVYLKLLKLSFVERTSHVLSYLVFLFICLFIVFCVLLFGGFGMAEGLADLGIPKFFSFLIVIGCFLILLWVMVASRKKITGKLGDVFIDVLTDDASDNNEKQQN